MASTESTTHDPASPLVAAIQARPRPCVEFDAGGFLGLAEKPIGKYRIRVAVKAEIDRAIVAAHAYVRDRTAGNAVAATDEDILRDNKTIAILHSVCRDFAAPDAFTAFPSPAWMRETLTTYQIAVLLNHYNEVVRTSQPVESVIDDARVEAVASYCAKNASNDTPNKALMAFSREQCAEILVRLSVKLFEERAAHTAAETVEGRPLDAED